MCHRKPLIIGIRPVSFTTTSSYPLPVSCLMYRNGHLSQSRLKAIETLYTHQSTCAGATRPDRNATNTYLHFLGAHKLQLGPPKTDAIIATAPTSWEPGDWLAACKLHNHGMSRAGVPGTDAGNPTSIKTSNVAGPRYGYPHDSRLTWHFCSDTFNLTFFFPSLSSARYPSQSSRHGICRAHNP